mmetsp:Transcript_4643/g.13342  ORF Transcript_4643/g.13342 Transcript_4643/m.13342 type:complete len:1521 (-) Transcript_4643:659-5221(-)|eukprot:CAMPEP_0206144924 /NCGR_PEP_ID=MMETSP1473-20131121/25903_1 /ASSEMBLY_ACC=CAM_ASM_001109 /TAXON_ID=1461547 /ORGANISM="Stichococcus sp, Strain RCC1054" /LENGTH=1520 /DNA_ID=CAMNT_0053540951 /DNA_START=250 /DNA_END=4812 /DNA_ORIENTATION=-
MVFDQSLGGGNRSFEQKHGGSRHEMWHQDEGGAVPPEVGMPGANARPNNSRRDLEELVQASISLASRKSIHPVSEDVAAEAAAVAATGKGGGRSGRRPKPVHMGRAERESLADALLSMGRGKGDEKTFFDHLARRLQAAGVQLPTVQLEYSRLTLEADASVGSAALPSLTNTVKSVFLSLVRQHRVGTQPVSILKDVSGVLQPGKLVLLMGPPGSGKSVFLKALGGRLKPSSELRWSGEVKYNGLTTQEFCVERAIGLVDQYDDHLPMMTVRETLEFARKCQMSSRPTNFSPVMEAKRLGYGHPSGKAGITNNHKEGAPPTGEEDEEAAELQELLAQMTDPSVRVELIIKLLGLTRCADTVVGNAVLRGVSGGEKKRVTTAEILVGPRHVLLMDEISTGLDSATTFNVVQWLRTIAHALKLTVVISLLQPQPEVWDLFDETILLTDGKVMYHGEINGALPFFRTLGFQCPERKDAASFLQEVTTPKGQLTFATPQLRKSCGLQDLTGHASAADAITAEFQASKELLVSVDEIGDAFWETERGRTMRDTLDNHPFDKSKGHPEALPKARYAMPFVEAAAHVTMRQLRLTLRDTAITRGRWVQVTVMSLIIGSLFWMLDSTYSGARNFFAVSFFSVLFLAMGSMPQMAVTLQQKSVFYKQRGNNFFQPSIWAVSMAVTQVPWALVECVIYSLIVYFFVDFFHGPGYFFCFFMLCILGILVMSSFFRLLAAVAPSMVVAQSLGAFSLLVLVISSGFAIVKGAIPDYLIWAYWISPFQYLLNAVVINEMTSPAWNEPYPGFPNEGKAALASFDFASDRSYIWKCVIYVVFLVFLLTGAASAALKYINPPSTKPTLPGAVAADIHEKRSRRNLTQRLGKRHSQRVRHKAAIEAVAEEGGQEASQATLDFEPITLVVRHLSYFVPAPPGIDPKKLEDSQQPGKLQLLRDLTFSCEPGVLTALMGGSGAGKTTLMDVVAGRKTQGDITGDILVNGHPKVQATWSRAIGYVEQTDIHSAATTVQEALFFSARMRLPAGNSDQQIRAHVEEVMRIVELDVLRDSLVGAPGQDGLSVEARKRLSIAVEQVANPSVVFLDEPTSGLDARAAVIVMHAIRNIANAGRCILVTIHQPSIEIFEAFDAMVLLQAGGRMTYFGRLGEQSSELIRYLEAVPGVTPFKPGHNPATWMLEVSGGAASISSSAAAVDFPEYYKASAEYKAAAEEADQLAEQLVKTHEPLKTASTYATPIRRQFLVLCHKFFVIYWRSPAYNVTRVFMTCLIALLYGAMYFNKGTISDGAQASDVQNVMGVLFSTSAFQGMFNLMSAMPVVGFERSVYYRERAASMYSSAAFSGALALVEVPFVLLQSVLFSCIAYFMIGFANSAKKFFFFLLVFFLDLILFTVFGQFLVYITPSIQMATVVASGLNALWQLMNGFVISYNEMPVYWKWFNRITPTTWILQALASDQLGDVQTQVTTFNGQQSTASQFLEDYFNYKYNFRWFAVLIVFCFIIFFRVGSVLALRFVNFNRR